MNAVATYDAAYQKLIAARIARDKVCAAANDICTTAYAEYIAAEAGVRKASSEKVANLPGAMLHDTHRVAEARAAIADVADAATDAAAIRIAAAIAVDIDAARGAIAAAIL